MEHQVMFSEISKRHNKFSSASNGISGPETIRQYYDISSEQHCTVMEIKREYARD